MTTTTAICWRRGPAPQGRAAQRRQIAHALIEGSNGLTLCGIQSAGLLVNLPEPGRLCQRCEKAATRVVPW